MIKSAGKSFLSKKLLNIPFLNKKIIFVYHHIHNDETEYYNSSFSTKLENFKNQIEFFVSNTKIVSLDDITDNNRDTQTNNKWEVAITFDDGFYSVFKNALPILKKHRIPFTIFLNETAIKSNQLWITNLVLRKNDLEYLKSFWTKVINQEKCSFDNFIENPISATMQFGVFNERIFETYFDNVKGEKIYLDENSIKKMLRYEYGIIIGNHTCDHLVLSKAEDKIAFEQISRNNKFLTNSFNTPISDFAIPFGKKEHYELKHLKYVNEYKNQKIFTSNPMRLKESDFDNVVFPRVVLTDNSTEELIFYMNRTLVKNYNL